MDIRHYHNMPFLLEEYMINSIKDMKDKRAKINLIYDLITQLEIINEEIN